MINVNNKYISFLFFLKNLSISKDDKTSPYKNIHKRILLLKWYIKPLLEDNNINNIGDISEEIKMI